MPFVQTPDVRLYYRLEGYPDLPVIVLSHSLGADHGMWDPQMPVLLDHFRVLRYDTRGHGASSAPAGEYSIESLARDVLALADALEIRNFAFCGLSLGGMTGQWIAGRVPGRITAMVLANTSAKFPDPAPMEARRRTVLERGMEAVADAVLARFFSPETLASNPYAATTKTTLLATDPQGYAGCCAAVRDLDNRSILPAIRVPTLVIGSDTDASTPWAGHGDLLLASIAGAKALNLRTAHLSNIEEDLKFTAALLEFLQGS